VTRAIAVVVFLAACSEAERKPPPAAASASPHGAAMDDAMASVLAMYSAPEGATPCESAHNAFAVEAAEARRLGRASQFSFVADRAAFLAGCAALAPDAQPCLVPRYRARHRDACDRALPAAAALSHLFVIRE